MRILVVNAGSSTLKLRLLGDDDALLDSWDAWPTAVPPVDGVVHRFVHGGASFRKAVVIDSDVEKQLDALVPLAPLHQPKSLAALNEAQLRFAQVPHVACFDTAFHATIPLAAATYALPHEWLARYEIRRYGFHGLSHAWVAKRVAALVSDARRVVSCHLGAGASLCAILDGVSVDTTMGFTPMEGLVMATRPGDVDPGLLMWLTDREPDLADRLEHGSGLTGLAGTGDMRELLARNDDDARLAVDVFVHRLRKGIAAMAAAMAGIDVCVFTGGIGENAPAIRSRTLAGLEFLGLAVEPTLNAAAHGDTDISPAASAVKALIVEAREDLEMAHQAGTVLASQPSANPAMNSP